MTFSPLQNLVVAPVLIPLATGIILIFFARMALTRRWIAAISSGLQLAGACAFLWYCFVYGGLALTAGGWPYELGITLAVDLLSAVMLTLSTFTVLISNLFAFATGPRDREHPMRTPLVQFMAAGIHLAFITGDLFNLFVAFEVMLLASYALLTMESDDHDVKLAYPYLALNLVGSAIFLGAAGAAYAMFGTLNFAELAQVMQADDPRVLMVGLMLLLVFGVKSALFPLYYWLPNSYPILPSALSALYSGMLTKVGVYVFLRVFVGVLPEEMDQLHFLIAWLSGLTMLFGVLGAVSRRTLRGILSFHIISQIGFMLLALGLYTPLSIAAAIFYVIHHIIVKASLFLVAGVVSKLNRSDSLSEMGSLWRLTPFVGVIFLLQAFSLAGIPPLSGFWGKYLIVEAGIASREYALVVISLVASILTLYSMLKIWNAAFWGEHRDGDAGVRLDDTRWKRMAAVATIMALVSVGIGLGAEGVMQVSQEAAERLMDRGAYLELVRTGGVR